MHQDRSVTELGLIRRKAGMGKSSCGDHEATNNRFDLLHHRGMDNVLGPNASPPRKGTPLMAASYTIGSETTVRHYL